MFPLSGSHGEVCILNFFRISYYQIPPTTHRGLTGIHRIQAEVVCQWERGGGLGIAVDVSDRICPGEPPQREMEISRVY
jgi:hypothetical protein